MDSSQEQGCAWKYLWKYVSILESGAVFRYLLHLLQNQPCFPWTRRCAVIPVLHGRLSPGSGLLHHCMDIHLPSVSALAKCFTKTFSKVYDGRNQNLLKILRLLFLYLFGSSTNKKVCPFRINVLKRFKVFEMCILEHQEALLFTLQEWQFWFSVFLLMFSFFSIS